MPNSLSTRLTGCRIDRNRTIVKVGIAYLELAEKGKAPNEVLLLHDGPIDWADFEDVTLDAASARAVIAAFKKQGVDIPIDYHHATTKTDDGRKAPAAGWVTALSYEAGKGLVASITWSEAAKREIESEQYKYLSPVIFWDEDKKIVLELDSVALTNKPRTRNMPPLLEAAERRMSRRRMESDEMPKNKDKKNMRRPLAWRKLSKAEEVMPGLDVDVEEMPTEDVQELDEVGAAVATLADAIRDAGGELSDDADTVSILAMAADMISAKPADEETEEETEEVAEEVTDALGLDKKASAKAACAEINRLKIAKGTNKTTAERLVAVEKELAERNAADKKRTIAAAIEVHVEAGRLNPNDTDQMTAALALAENDLESFEAFAKSLPVVGDPSKLDFTGSTATAKGARGSIISDASKEYRKLSEPQRDPVSITGWVNAALDDEREGRLTKAERETLEV